MSTSQDRVLIVGAGPVGLSAALFLVNDGVAVTVVEQEPALPDDMRASTFHAPTLDMLDCRGVTERMIDDGYPVPRWQYRDHETGDSVVFDLTVLAGDTRHPFRLQCEQFKLCRIIVAALAGDPLFDLRLGTRVVDLVRNAQGVAVTTERNGKRASVAGRYLIAADGAKSTIRELLGLKLEGETYPRSSITLVVDFPFEAYLDGILPVNYNWSETDHFGLMRVKDFWRVGYSPRPGQSIEEALSDDSVQRQLQHVYPTGKPYKVLHKAVYTTHRRIIDTFRHGRVLFVGDAAHLNSPSGGMGMNSGVHDAHSLATKLVRVWRGEDESLLDLYSHQRRTIALEDVQILSDANYRNLREKDPEARAKIWAEMRATASDRQAMRSYLLRSSMIESVRKSDAIALPVH